MKLTWKDGVLSAVIYDERGLVLGELQEDSDRRCRALVGDKFLGLYISREHARKAVEAELAKGKGAPPEVRADR